MNLLSIDPGKHHVAWAAFCDGHLTRCGLTKVVDIPEFFHTRSVDKIVAEIPQVYTQNKWEGDPNDLIAITITVGRVLNAVQAKTEVLIHPSEWKGQRKKEVDNPYTISLLKPDELAVYQAMTEVPKYLRHNVIDAIGIGLWGLERR